MSQSILNSVKKLLGPGEEYTHFDPDLIININSAIATLTQLGVGPAAGFQITGPDETYEDFLGADDPRLNFVQQYLYLKTRVIFDPPTQSYVLQAYKDQIAELEWRLNVQVDPGTYFEVGA